MSPPRSILLRYSAYLAERLGVAGLALFQPDETISFLPGEVGNAVAVLPDIRSLLGHPESPSWIALARMMQTAPLAVLARPLPGFESHGDSQTARTLVEFSETLTQKGLRVDLAGWTRTEVDVPTLVAIITNRSAPVLAAAPAGFRVIALISTRNEADILGWIIQHLVEDGVDVYVIDDESTDDTLAIARSYVGRGVIGCESFSATDPANHWYDILRRKEELAHELPADWFIHHDADEIRKSPWPGVRLKDAIYRVDQEGFSCIDFTVLEFRATDNAFKQGEDPQKYFRYFEFGDATRAFRTDAGLEEDLPQGERLAETGGHSVSFLGARTYPYKFLMRHYPVRSQQHGEKKILHDRVKRYAEEYRARDWHGHYFSPSQGRSFLSDPDQLTAFDMSFYTRFLVPRTSGLGIIDTNLRAGSVPVRSPAAASASPDPGKQQPAVVCIAGMHRSGTSLLARMLNICGLYLGDPRELMGAGPDNPEGHWEHLRFLNINESVLASLQGAWDLPPSMQSGWFQQPETSRLRHEAQQLIGSFANHGPWGWKDPRNTLMFPFWRDLIPGLQLVACLRDPLEVAQSLAVRGSSSVAFSMNLWKTYNARLLDLSNEGIGLIIHFDALLYAPAGELARVLEFLHMTPSTADFDLACRAARSTLKHHENPVEEIDRLKAYPDVLALYSQLCERAGPNYQRLRRDRAELKPDSPRGSDTTPAIPRSTASSATSSPGEPVPLVESPSYREPPERPIVSVVIPNYNGWDDLQTCLHSLGALDFSTADLETIVVDNGSSDSSPDLLRSEFPFVRVIRNRTNVGFSVAANQGAAAAAGRYIAFLNNDMRLERNWLNGLLDAIRREPDIACAGSMVLNWDGTAVDYFGRSDDLFCLRIGAEDKPPVAQPSDPDVHSLFASGGAMLIRADIFEDLGGFDTDFFMYHEDVDLGWRAWLRGWKVVLAPRSVVYHKGQASSSKLPVDLVRRMQLRNMLSTAFKNLSDAEVMHVLPMLLYFLLERGQAWQAAAEPLPDLLPQFATSLGSALQKRSAIQSSRVRSDDELFSDLSHPFGFLRDEPRYVDLREEILERSGARRLDLTDADTIRLCLSEWLNTAQFIFQRQVLKEIAGNRAAIRTMEARIDVFNTQITKKDARLEALSGRLVEKGRELTELARTLQSIRGSRSWKWAQRLARIYRLIVPGSSNG